MSQNKIYEITVPGGTLYMFNFEHIGRLVNRSAMIVSKTPSKKQAHTVMAISSYAGRAARFARWTGPIGSWVAPVFSADEAQSTFFFNVFIARLEPFEAAQRYFDAHGIPLSDCGLFSLSQEFCKAYKGYVNVHGVVVYATDDLMHERKNEESACGG